MADAEPAAEDAAGEETDSERTDGERTDGEALVAELPFAEELLCTFLAVTVDFLVFFELLEDPLDDFVTFFFAIKGIGS